MKTTILGVLTIIGGVLTAVTTFMKTGTLDSQTLTTVTSTVAAGIGLIHAADATKGAAK